MFLFPSLLALSLGASVTQCKSIINYIEFATYI